MKKLLVILMVVAMASFLFVGCIPGVTPEPEPEPEPEPTPTPTTVAPIITTVPDVDDDDYVNKAEAADGIVVNGTGPTYSEIKLFIDGVFAGTGDVTATGAWTVDVAKTDLGEDADKVMYATAIEAGLAESDKSNEVEFTLDTVAPKIKAVKARGGTALVTDAAVTYQTFPAAVVAPLTLPMYTAVVFDVAQLLPGVVNWKVEILTIAGGPGAIVSVRVHNLTAGTAVDYTFVNAAAAPVTSSISWIPGATVTVAEPCVVGAEAGLNPALHVGAYCLIKTTNTDEILGRVSLTYDEDVSYTQATGGAYTIFNNFTGWDILTNVTAFIAYNETTDTMFWEEWVTWGGNDLSQGQWLTFQVDTVADIAGNAIAVGSPETANCTILAPTVAVGP